MPWSAASTRSFPSIFTSKAARQRPPSCWKDCLRCLTNRRRPAAASRGRRAELDSIAPAEARDSAHAAHSYQSDDDGMAPERDILAALFSQPMPVATAPVPTEKHPAPMRLHWE